MGSWAPAPSDVPGCASSTSTLSQACSPPDIYPSSTTASPAGHVTTDVLSCASTHPSHAHLPPFIQPITQNLLVRQANTGLSGDTHPSTTPLSIAAWNGRGFQSAAPYIVKLAQAHNIVILSEHWLWPYELHKLDAAVDGFSSIAISNKRLTEHSSLHRGCGGVAILWRNTIKVIPAPTHSDRFVAIQVPTSNFTLTIIGVYLPSTDHDISEFTEYLHDLESFVSATQATGPVIVMGDFNAHLPIVCSHSLQTSLR